MSYARDRVTNEMPHGNEHKTLNNATSPEIFDWWRRQPSPQSQASKRSQESRVEYAVQEGNGTVALFHHLIDDATGEVHDTVVAVFIASYRESAQWLAALLNNNVKAREDMQRLIRAQKNGGTDAQTENKR